MKRSELKELRKKEKKELEKLLEEKRKDLQKTYFDVKLGKSKNVSKIKKVKKDIAQILTILREKWQNKN